jgi:hypothetical protein
MSSSASGGARVLRYSGRELRVILSAHRQTNRQDGPRISDWDSSGCEYWITWREVDFSHARRERNSRRVLVVEWVPDGKFSSI